MSAFSILYSIVDDKGATSTTEVKVPSITSLADVPLFAMEMAKLIDPLIRGAISRIGVAISVQRPVTLKVNPVAGSDVEEGARFQFGTLGGFNTGLRLPTFDEAKINVGSKDVDQTDADVLAFMGGMLTGVDISGVGGSGTISPSDGRDADIQSLKYAVESFQNSRKRTS